MRREIEQFLWCIAVIAGAGAAVGWRSIHPIQISLPPRHDPSSRIPPAASPESLASAAQTATALDPFRPQRRPSLLPYHIGNMSVNPVVAPTLPAFTLKGTIGGPHGWRAIVDGVPEHPGGIVVSTGDLVGELRVRAITATAVVLARSDTTIRLSIARTWQ